MQTIEDNMKNITPNQEEASDMNVKETIETDENGNLSVESNVFAKEFENPAEAIQTTRLLDQLGMTDKYEMQMKGGKAFIVLQGIDSHDLDVLQRKIRINAWSSRTIAVADTVTGFATDVADYALNGAVAPVVGSVANAGITTARVVGTATVKAGAMVATSALKNGRRAVNEIRHSDEVQQCWAEVKKCGQDLASLLFGSDFKASSDGAGSAGGWQAVTR